MLKQSKSFFFAGSKQVFNDSATFFACTSEECVFCEEKTLGTTRHLKKQHFTEAIYFSDSNTGRASHGVFCTSTFHHFKFQSTMLWSCMFFQVVGLICYCQHLTPTLHFYSIFLEKFVIACFCKDGTNKKRSHYHCPQCSFRPYSRANNFISHLKNLHGTYFTFHYRISLKLLKTYL